MAYRIVKEIYPNNYVNYKVQHNTIFGIPTPFWWNCIREINNLPFVCEFDTLNEARDYVQSLLKNKCIITKEIINTKIFKK